MNLVDRDRGRAARPRRIDGVPGHRRTTRRLVAVRDRLDEPLRVAIAGRVKAGKSTLLNALVGERLAPTDAGECTRDRHLVPGRPHLPGDAATRSTGEPRQLRFSRDDGAIEIDLGGLTPGGRRPSSW